MEVSLVDVVCQHLALVAVDGAGPTVAATLHPDFQVHLDGVTTGASGYLALIEARWAVEGSRPPLDVTSTAVRPSAVTAAIAPNCVMHVRVDAGLLAEMWLTTTDPAEWVAWLDDGQPG